jgi:hypothetical protein
MQVRDIVNGRYLDMNDFDVTVGGFGSSKAWFNTAGNLDFPDSDGTITGIIDLTLGGTLDTSAGTFTMGDSGTIYSFSNPDGDIYWDASSSRPLYFRDTGIVFQSPQDGMFEITSDIALNFTSPEINLDGNVNITGAVHLQEDALVNKTILFAMGGGGGYNNSATFLGYGLDDSTDETHYFRQQMMPLDYEEGTPVTIKVYWYSTATQAGENVLKFRARNSSASDGELLSTTADYFDYVQVTLANNEEHHTLHLSDAGIWEGISPGAMVGLAIHRDANGVEDTMGGDMVIIGALLEYTADKLGEV